MMPTRVASTAKSVACGPHELDRGDTVGAGEHGDAGHVGGGLLPGFREHLRDRIVATRNEPILEHERRDAVCREPARDVVTLAVDRQPVEATARGDDQGGATAVGREHRCEGRRRDVDDSFGAEELREILAARMRPFLAVRRWRRIQRNRFADRDHRRARHVGSFVRRSTQEVVRSIPAVSPTTYYLNNDSGVRGNGGPGHYVRRRTPLRRSRRCILLGAAGSRFRIPRSAG